VRGHPEPDDAAEGEGYVGTAFPRREDDRLVQGEGAFLDDIEPAGDVHHVAIKRSPFAHARITEVDTSDAEALEGVVAVVTGADVRETMDPFAVSVQDPPTYYPMAAGRVRYNGEPVALVVATDKYRASDAIDEIDVSYDRLDPVLDEREAAADGAPQLHESGNVANDRELSYGPVESAFERADHVVETEFTFPRYTSAPLETYGVVADYDRGDDSARVWSNFQGPFTLHPVVAGALGMAEADLRFETPADNGGSFGLKAHIYPYIALCVVASRVAGHPVKWIESRREHLLASGCHTDRTQRMRGAVTDDGDLLGIWTELYDNFGAYVRAPEPGNTFRPLGNFTGPYDVDAFGGEFYAVQTNKCPAGLNRGYGCHQYYFGLERLVDQLAESVGMDPLAFRRQNFVDADAFPHETPTGGIYDSGRYGDALDRAADLIDYEAYRKRQHEAREAGRYVGIGAAAVVDPSTSNMGYVSVALPPAEREQRYPKSGGLSTATVGIQPDASVVVELDTAPNGQGHETTASQIVADELGVAPETITVDAGMDTSGKGWSVSSGTYSSRFASVGHNAVQQAAQEVAETARRIAAHVLDCAPDAVALREGRAHGPDGDSASIKQIAGTAHWNPSALPADLDPGLREQATFAMPDLDPIDADDRINSSGTYGYGVDLVAVEVDPETGEVEILDYVAVHDAGTVVNPMIVEGQVAGGIFHGVAGALYEELAYDDAGNLQADTFMDYAVPTAKEAPTVTIDHLETPSPKTPMGSKGTGESGAEAAPAAVANAVDDALDPLGVEITSLPLRPRTVWELIHGETGE
jgi:2-furoyl-CoA dehydrogenase large subunit